MTGIYGIPYASMEIARLGRCELKGNWLRLFFDEVAPARLGADLRPFVLLGRALKDWPANLVKRPDEAVVWANPRGVVKDHRPQVWRGWPIDDDLAVLVPVVEVGKLAGYSRKQDGFLRRLSC